MKRMIFNEQLTKQQFASWLNEVQGLASELEVFLNSGNPQEPEDLRNAQHNARTLWYRIHDIQWIKD